MLPIRWLNTLLYSLFFNPRLRKLRQSQLLVALTIFTYMALSSSPMQISAILSDKLLHFVGNLLLIGSIWVAFFGAINGRRAVLFAIIYSLSIESIQALTKSRQPDLADAFANLLGIFIGFGICRITEKYLLSLRKVEKEEST